MSSTDWYQNMTPFQKECWHAARHPEAAEKLERKYVIAKELYRLAAVIGWIGAMIWLGGNAGSWVAWLGFLTYTVIMGAGIFYDSVWRISRVRKNTGRLSERDAAEQQVPPPFTWERDRVVVEERGTNWGVTGAEVERNWREYAEKREKMKKIRGESEAGG